MNRRAEEIRIRHLYRNLILRKRLNVPFEAALKMVGPDCAYHLYSRTVSSAGKSGKAGKLR